jgi:hypothetical protein
LQLPRSSGSFQERVFPNDFSVLRIVVPATAKQSTEVATSAFSHGALVLVRAGYVPPHASLLDAQAEDA